VSYLYSLKTLSKQISYLQLKLEAEEKVLHNRFNVFTTLLQAHDEVRLHTRFLHMLLNPEAHHDCNRLFLDLFLNTLSDMPVLGHADESSLNSQLLDKIKNDKFVYGKNEYSAGEFGQFDIYLEFENSIILIENKIYAGEQDNQLERYATFLEEQKKKQTLLLYLTLDGKASDSAHGHQYYRISYKEHILTWLNQCLKNTYNYININQSIQQYKQVIESLLGIQYGSKIMDKVAEFLKENPEIIKNWPNLVAAREQLYRENIKVFFNELLVALKDEPEDKRLTICERPGMDGPSFEFDPHCGFKVTPSLDNFMTEFKFEIWIERREAWRAFYIGIESNWEKEISEKETDLLQKVRLKLEEKKIEGTLWHLTDPGKTWHGAQWPVGRTDLVDDFFNINNDTFNVKMLNKKEREKVINEAKEKILEYIDILRVIFTELK
jgi:PD-(D/E)XK nuclease superfamily protein